MKGQASDDHGVRDGRGWWSTGMAREWATAEGGIA